MAARQKSLIAVVAALLLVISGGLTASDHLTTAGNRQVAGDLPPSREAWADRRDGPRERTIQPALSRRLAERPDSGGGGQLSGNGRTPRRIISLVPALTEMLFAIGAGAQVIGVSSYDDFPAAAKSLPRVGALLDPDVERILALRPDLVFTYGSQGGLEAQLARAGIRTFSYSHGGLDALFQTLRDVGEATGHPAGADRTVKEINAKLDAVRASMRGRQRPKTLLVFGRQPQSLRQIYVSGGAGVLHELLEAAGGVNVFGDMLRESVQPTREALIERRPDVILEVSGTRAATGANQAEERAVWSALPSIPAVRNGRIHFLTGDYLVVPGPRIGLAAEALARALHPDAFR